jgi:hypothetical protein
VSQDGKAGNASGIELRLTVWTEAKAGWHARVVAPDATVREFESPFELVRFLLWPADPAPSGERRGLR